MRTESFILLLLVGAFDDSARTRAIQIGSTRTHKFTRPQVTRNGGRCHAQYSDIWFSSVVGFSRYASFFEPT